MWTLRKLFESIKNLFVWLPVIWNDRQWDSWYIEKILLKKITLIRNSTQKRAIYVGWENELKWMNYCIYLLTMLTENKYWEDEWDDVFPNRRGFSEHLTKNKEYIDYSYSKDKFCYADLWEDKTRTLFWKIFTWRYEYWWD